MNKYTIIGGGRLARHFSHYFQLLDIPFNQWQRTSIDADELKLRHTTAESTHILLLISDRAIPEFLATYTFLSEKILIHCSGAHSYSGLAGVHPLMTFGEELYDLTAYEAIPMICEKNSNADFLFPQLFPQLKNPVHYISAEQKALYHAYCVCAGNFSQLLWQMSTQGMHTQLGLPSEVLHPYLQQNLENFFKQGSASLTGPLVRGDTNTVAANLAALENQPLESIYRQFSELFLKTTNYHGSEECAA